jgi:hypothetical protein
VPALIATLRDPVVGVAAWANDALDWVGWPGGGRGSSAGAGSGRAAGQGGRFGGGGATASFAADSTAASSGQSPLAGASLPEIDLGDGDDALPLLLVVVLVIVVAVVALSVVGGAVWMFMAMPQLLAEAAGGAVLTGAALRERGGWLAATFRRSWGPAAITGAGLTLAGFALGHSFPSVHTWGEALWLLRG